MGNKNFCKRKGDKRKLRHSHASGFDKLLMRMLPREPFRLSPTVVVDSPSVTSLLLRLPLFLREVEAELKRQVFYNPEDMVFGTYIDELACTGERDLLCYGAYILSEAGHGRRVLYIGGAASAMVRHRITDHLGFRGGKRLMLQALRDEIEEQFMYSHHKEDLRPYENALLQAFFSRHQWFDVPEGRFSEQQRYAIETIANGAFEITYVAFPKEDRLLGRALEVFLIDSVFSETGKLPPLNAIPAIVTEKTLAPKPADRITMQQLSRIVARARSAALVI